MQNLTPTQIVAELDRFIIGQAGAKRAVAVAIRNRWRRQQLSEEMAREVYPKNIIMIGPTGVGKTEIARRLAKLTGAPFVKVEASKYTEVGYHGRDVESMVRDLLDQSLSLVRTEMAESVREKATDGANERIVDLLLPPTPSYSSRPFGFEDEPKAEAGDAGDSTSTSENTNPADEEAARMKRTRERLLKQVASGKLDEKEVELTLSHRPQTSVMFANMGIDQMDPDMASMLEKIIPEQNKTRRLSVASARQVLIEQETDKLLDKEKITTEAIRRCEEGGIIFIDEIDKVATSSEGVGRGPDVSRQGVQRDLLPIVEGSAVTTRHGIVHTDHILFIAAGAFHSAAVSDLMPELQGRFPIRVELSPLTREDFIRILKEPHNALTKQQQHLLAIEGLEVVYDDGAIDAIAELAAQANAQLENIGARRLMTIVEKVFEEINFDAPQRVAGGEKKITITDAFVRERVAEILKDEDLSRFVL